MSRVTQLVTRLTRILLRYDMYAAEDSRAPSVVHQRDETEGGYPLESGPAIEVIELANGETVWYVFRHVSKCTFDVHAKRIQVDRQRSPGRRQRVVLRGSGEFRF